MTTFGEAIARAERRLSGAGVPEPRRDARLLLADLLECDVATIIAWPERSLSTEAEAAFEQRVDRRLRREPVSRILERREFWSLPFVVSHDTLDPRPDSEALVAALLDQIGERQQPLRVLDLGTGTGCLLLALLSELPNATGLGIDCSAGAVATARENAFRLGLDGRAEIRLGNWTEGVEEAFDVLICNPPYIPDSEIAGLEPEVAHWEPRAALAGGEDGLDPYRLIIPQLAHLLRPTGIAGFEHGLGQAKAIEALVGQEQRWRSGRVKDLAGHDRALIIFSEGAMKKKQLESPVRLARFDS